MAFSITERSAPKSKINIQLHTCQGNESNCSHCTSLQQVSFIKYLEVSIDEHLTWAKHIEILSGRIRKLMYIFKRLRGSAQSRTLKLVYFALCQSNLSYCASTWGTACKTTTIKLERAQRAVIKVAFQKPYRYPTDQLYKETKLMTVRQLAIEATILKFNKTAIDTLVETRFARRQKWAIPRF